MRSKWIILNRVDRDLWEVSPKHYIAPGGVYMGGGHGFSYDNVEGKYLSTLRCHDVSEGWVKAQEDGTLEFQFWYAPPASCPRYVSGVVSKDKVEVSEQELRVMSNLLSIIVLLFLTSHHRIPFKFIIGLGDSCHNPAIPKVLQTVLPEFIAAYLDKDWKGKVTVINARVFDMHELVYGKKSNESH